MLFKSGTYFTGGISTIGTSSNTSRLSFFTQASSDMNSLVERMAITNSGYVGINVNAPQHILHVRWTGIGLTQESSTGEAKVGFYTSGISAYLQTHNNVPLYFATNNGSAQMTLATNGRFGIGTTSPVSKLEVKGKTTISQQAGEDVALEVNGPIKVGGSYPAAFVVTADNEQWIEIDHPSSNGNINAIILVTPRSAIGDYIYEGSVRVDYNSLSEKWYIEPTGIRLEGIYDDISLKHCDNSCVTLEGLPITDFMQFYPGMKFNVLVIDK
jgi:hypothetical protein